MRFVSLTIVALAAISSVALPTADAETGDIVNVSKLFSESHDAHEHSCLVQPGRGARCDPEDGRSAPANNRSDNPPL